MSGRYTVLSADTVELFSTNEEHHKVTHNRETYLHYTRKEDNEKERRGSIEGKDYTMPYISGFPSVLFHEVWHLPSAFILQKLVKDFGGMVDQHRLPLKFDEEKKHHPTQRTQVIIPFHNGKVQFEMLTMENVEGKFYFLSEPLEDCLDAVTRVKLFTLFLNLCDGRVDPSSYDKNVALTERLRRLEKKVEEQRFILTSLQ